MRRYRYWQSEIRASEALRGSAAAVTATPPTVTYKTAASTLYYTTPRHTTLRSYELRPADLSDDTPPHGHRRGNCISLRGLKVSGIWTRWASCPRPRPHSRGVGTHHYVILEYPECHTPPQQIRVQSIQTSRIRPNRGKRTCMALSQADEN